MTLISVARIGNDYILGYWANDENQNADFWYFFLLTVGFNFSRGLFTMIRKCMVEFSTLRAPLF